MITYEHPKTGKPVTHRPWTRREQQQLAELAAAGLTVAEIVKKLGRNSAGSVRFALQHYGIQHNNPRARRRWSSDETSEVARLSAQGLIAVEIAHLIPGRSASAVASQRRKMGLAHLASRRSRLPVTFDLDDTEEL